MRIDDTCMWMERIAKYQDWVRGTGKSILWVSGEPGSGKSVMASWVIDAMSERGIQSDVFYFFFDAKISTQTTAHAALQSIIHQVLETHPSLMKHAMHHFSTKGKKLIEELDVLWDILVACLKNTQLNGATLVLDGLDECEQTSRTILLRLIIEFFSTKNINGAKMFFTSRPSIEIADTVTQLSYTISLESSETTSYLEQDIQRVVRKRIECMPSLRKLSQGKKDALIKRLISNAERTFLWVALILDIIADIEDTSIHGIEARVQELPNTLEGLYKNILDKIRLERREKAKLILQLLIAAHCPLSLEELNVAWTVRFTDESVESVTQNLQTDITRTVRSLCGNFVRISDKTCYLIHGTAKEYLLSATCQDRSPWYGLDISIAHLVMAERTIWYLKLLRNEPSTSLLSYLGLAEHTSYLSIEFPPLSWLRYRLTKYCARFAFLGYALESWTEHLHEAERAKKSLDTQFIDTVIDVYSYNLVQLQWWLSVDWNSYSARGTRDISTEFPFHVLGLSAYYGHFAVLKRLLNSGCDINATLSPLTFTALHMAVFGRQDNMAAWLIEHGANLEAESSEGETPLLNGCFQDNINILKVLVEYGAVTNVSDLSGSTAFLRSVEHSSTAQVGFLLENGAKIADRNEFDEDALHIATSVRSLDKLKLLLDHGASVYTPDQYYRTPLHIAVEQDFTEAINILLQHGASTAPRDLGGRAALDIAIQQRNVKLIFLLLEAGADLNNQLAMEDFWKYTGSKGASDPHQDVIIEALLNQFESSDIDSPETFPTLLILAIGAGEELQVSHCYTWEKTPT